jgi:hypothetical protein
MTLITKMIWLGATSTLVASIAATEMMARPPLTSTWIAAATVMVVGVLTMSMCIGTLAERSGLLDGTREKTSGKVTT